MKTSFIKYERKDGHDLCEISLENDQGMTVKLLNYGATLEKVVMSDGKNMIMSLESPIDYSRERNFLGGTVGRICGRVKDGEWKHGNEIFQLLKNDGENHIHGGNGIDTRVWNFRPFTKDDKIGVIFTLFDPDGANGFPGDLKIKAVYELDNQNNLSYKLTALSDKLTIFNPANHTYFTLGDRAENLELKLAADYYLPVGEDGVPDQGMQEVANKAFDFRNFKKVKRALNSNDPQINLRNGLDHPFILNGNKPAAILRSADHEMVMTTNAPALVIYTGNHFNHTGSASNIGQYDGITLEAQEAPSASNDLDAITLLPGEKYKRKINWNFK